MDLTNAKDIKYYRASSNPDKDCAVNFTIGNKSYSVPMNENNTDYQEILAQVKAGTLTIKDAD